MSDAPAPDFLHVKPLAPYAADWRRTRGRLFTEPASPTRGDFQRDRDRLIHSTAFRRLAHKTQVFIPLEGDHFRTRLTHTIEVAQIARALARGLRLDEDLAEATALAHDLGHTCFGHAGEDVLDACMAPFGGFDHNAHALRIVTTLERRYADWDGLNLCYETLEGLVKHNGPLAGPRVPLGRRRPVPREIVAFDKIFPLDLELFASAEAQCAALADDIAYNAHDIDDGLRAGLFSLDDLRRVPFLNRLLAEIDALHPGLERVRAIHELVRRIITRFVEDAFSESARRLRLAAPQSIDDIRRCEFAVVAFSDEMERAQKEIKDFLFTRMYRHAAVLPVWRSAEKIVRGLFEKFFSDPESMPEEWAQAARPCDEAGRARVVSDYIAGMTDRYALAQAEQWLGGNAAEKPH
ncbi:deoxyguanosinetriphosphate triphosphohydrolase [Rhodoblastus sp.]|uniref:deoxyguanosinetriphosphate triphosphohydrolase n=1 Tax=Rhodoblastus sp. TaxID=1962975 RepID=UPI003FD70F33